jgi:SAM-dependent methyltransferase
MSLDPGVAAFVRANLPPPPARILEVGAGGGELARALREGGYDVTAIDPASESPDVRPVPLHELDASPGSFDGAVAVVSLHHIDPLEESCARLAELLRGGARLVVDELDVGEMDDRAAEWWLEQRGAHGHDPAEDDGKLRAALAHLHPLDWIFDALAPGFELGEPVRGVYLYRWGLDPSVRPVEEDLVARGALPAVGARFVALRRAA